jgi:molybdenum cofactor biosynthesis enzyme MoaA
MEEIEKYENYDFYKIHGILASYIHISDICNFNCKICKLPIEKKGKFESFDLIKKKIIISTKYNLKNIIFTGQEVLIHPELDKIIEFCFENAKVKYITFNTNGLGFSNHTVWEKIIKLEKYKKKIIIAVSINFFDEDSFSNWSGHQKCIFNSWVLGFKKFMNSKFEKSIDVILKKDIPIDKTLSFIYSLSPNYKNCRIRILDLLPIGYAKEEKYKKLKYTLTETLEEIKKIKKIHKGKIEFENFPICIFRQDALKKNEFFIYNFHLIFKRGIPLQYDPNIYENSYEGSTFNFDLDIKKLIKSYINVFQYLDECKGCFYKKVCYGIQKEYITFYGNKETNNEIKEIKKKNWN